MSKFYQVSLHTLSHKDDEIIVRTTFVLLNIECHVTFAPTHIPEQLRNNFRIVFGCSLLGGRKEAGKISPVGAALITRGQTD
jgi:hypothetical protein